MPTLPDPAHDAVCASQARHLLVVAPPGTGKTYLSVRLAGAAVDAGLSAGQQVLLTTFSNQARIQLEREASRQLRPDQRRHVHVTNYHSFFWRAVWAHRRALGLPLDVQLVSRKHRESALASVDSDAVRALKTHEGLLETLAEHRFARFQDKRTPAPDLLERLLAKLDSEQAAGRLVFDDLGALFWQLLERFPSLDEAFAARFPILLADEHQDASELQDAVVRRVGVDRLAIFADPMQLIYGFRGSRPERLARHIEECDERFELVTPHRWQGDPATGAWLLGVRQRLEGHAASVARPAACQISYARYPSVMKSIVRNAASSAFKDGLRSVAVLAAWGSTVAQMRSYLSREGLFPRQLGGADDFEQARDDIEQLPLLAEPQYVALHALDRLRSLVPTLPSAVADQVTRRIGNSGVNLAGNCNAEARAILTCLQPLYDTGASGYVRCLVAAMDSCVENHHHLPRIEAVRTLRSVAETGDEAEGNSIDLDTLLARYSSAAAAASQRAPRLDRGLFVMTAHQAKGKEFDCVILVDASERTFPDNEEGRRLFYVAMTRATRKWCVIAPTESPTPLLQVL